MSFLLALYEVDHATPTVTSDWDGADAGVPAVAHGTVTDISAADGEWTMTLGTTDSRSVTIVWHDAPSPAPGIGEQVLAVGMIRPRPDERIVLIALVAPVRTGRQGPTDAGACTQPVEREQSPAPEITAPELPRPTSQEEPPAVEESFPLRDEIFERLRDEHHREPWGVTQSRAYPAAAVVCMEDEDGETRDVLLAPWRRTLRKAGYRVQTRFDLLGTGQIGPTQGARWLLVEPGPPEGCDDTEQDRGLVALGSEQHQEALRSQAIIRYRAMSDLRR